MLPLIPWRLIGAASLVLIVALMGWRVSAWHDAYKALPGVKDALQREEGCLDGSKCRERQRALEAAQKTVSKEVVDEYEKELADLRGRPPVTRVIRVCRPSGAGNLRPPSSPQGTDGSSPSPGGVQPADEFNPQPLFDLAREADEVSARLRALQELNRSLSSH